MKAMVLAAGLGTRLRPLTDAIPKPMLPILDRPVMAHVVEACERQGFDRLVANLHWHADAIRGYFGDRLEYRYEPELLGTAGAVRNARDFFGDDPIVVVSGDSLSDLDLRALVERHRSAGGVATIAVKQVDDTREYGVVLHDSAGRVSGFQEKPHPDEALSHLASCGIYCFSAEVFDYFPEQASVDWAIDVFPVLLENDVPFHVYEIDGYWRDIGSIDQLRSCNFDALEGRLAIDVPASGTTAPPDCRIEGPVWIGPGCTIGGGVRLIGPVVIGAGSQIGDRAALREAVVLPGTTVVAEQLAVGAILGQTAPVRRPRARA